MSKGGSAISVLQPDCFQDVARGPSSTECGLAVWDEIAMKLMAFTPPFCPVRDRG